ncbi:MAG TPA: TMEM175 family protein [Ignavibacteria bacterium]|nr:TMEM175 family protein [Ignavibacteria bacterium]HQY51601.1 TMEM175 family protein [Ignavibacteria bacterium]HRA99594.1 TMEM175 family protein [Ignavibacteria bacterium]
MGLFRKNNLDINDESLLPKHRVEALCDGIFAIVMTIIILDLKTPENIPKDLIHFELPDMFFNLLPAIEAYVLSFLVLGVFWLRHQIQFKFITTVDRSIIVLNILFLMLTGFIPFTVGVLMKYPRSEFTFLIYALNLILISIIMIIHLNYIFSKSNVFTDSISEEDYTKTKILSYIPVLIFVISIFVSFYSVRMALFIIYLDPLFFTIYRSINYFKRE